MHAASLVRLVHVSGLPPIGRRARVSTFAPVVGLVFAGCALVAATGCSSDMRDGRDGREAAPVLLSSPGAVDDEPRIDVPPSLANALPAGTYVRARMSCGEYELLEISKLRAAHALVVARADGDRWTIHEALDLTGLDGGWQSCAQHGSKRVFVADSWKPGTSLLDPHPVFNYVAFDGNVREVARGTAAGHVHAILQHRDDDVVGVAFYAGGEFLHSKS